MLPAAHRLTESGTFRRAVRTGRRAGGSSLVVHLTTGSTDASSSGAPARAGFVVSRAVGNAVTRNRVQRRLRHLCREHLAGLAPGAVMVVRALPPAATATSAELAAELARLVRRVTSAPRAVSVDRDAS